MAKTTLERIQDIITADLDKIEEQSRSEKLDSLSASNLATYGKLEILRQKHERDQKEAARKEKLDDEEFDQLAATASKLLAEYKPKKAKKPDPV